MLKRSKKLAFGGLAEMLPSLFKSMGGAGGANIPGMEGNNDLMSKVSGGKGSIVGKVTSGINPADMINTVSSLIPEKKSPLQQQAEQVDATGNQIGGFLKQGATTAVDAFIPGGGKLLSTIDAGGQALAKTGKVGKAINSTLNPLNTIGGLGKLATGDVTGFVKATPVGDIAELAGIDIGKSASERAYDELLRKKDIQATKDYKANNTAYNAQYGLAKKGMKFQQGGVLESYNTDNNVILKGVLHSQKNSIGDKGIPVMSCVDNKCEKVAEIEKEELVFTKGNTRVIDSYVAKYNKSKTKSVKDTIALQLGKFIKQQLDKNTIDNTDKML